MLRSGRVHLQPATVKKVGSAINSTKRHVPLRPGLLTGCNRQKGGVSYQFNKEICSAPAGFTYPLQPSRGRGQPSIQQAPLWPSSLTGCNRQEGEVSPIDSIKRHAPLWPGSLTGCNRQEGGVSYIDSRDMLRSGRVYLPPTTVKRVGSATSIQETCSAPAEFTYNLQPSRGWDQP